MPKAMPKTKIPNTKPSQPLAVTWQLVPFGELSTYQIYNIIQAREQVFVKDQNCSYIDADGLDFEAMHLSAYVDDTDNESSDNERISQNIQNMTSQKVIPQLLAYCRILAPENSNHNDTHTSYPRIGRVLVLDGYRGYGLARQLMIQAIDYCHVQFPNQPIHISAQTYLIEFYQSLGFICDGAVYSEQGIEHIHMIL